MSAKTKMKEFSIKALARIISAKSSKTIDGTFTGVSTDSRTIKPGNCFFAIRGENFDGHDYLSNAFAKGAACAVVEDHAHTDATTDCLLKVGSCLDALGDFARHYRSQSDFKVIAITGSVGKTTTRQIIYHVLRQHFRVFQAPKNYNNKIGLPLTLLSADPGDEIIVAELGSNAPGEIAYLTQIAKPDIAVVTNVSSAHLAGFGDLQTILEEKLSISQGLAKKGSLIINADSDLLLNACRLNRISFSTFGKSNGCDIQAKNITYNTNSSEFTVDGTPVSLPLSGPGNVENALAAWSVCCRFGMSILDFAHALKTLPGIPMRAESLRIGSIMVINDCYNANPASMKNALEILTNLAAKQTGRLVFICGDMAELGRQAEKLHAELGTQISQAGVQLLVAIGPFAKIAAQTATAAASYDLQTKYFEDTASACNNLRDFIEDSDIVLVKGSRYLKLEAAVERLREIFAESIPKP